MTGMEGWRRGWRDRENLREGVCDWKRWRTRNKQQASDSQSPLILALPLTDQSGFFCSFFTLHLIHLDRHSFILHPYLVCLWFALPLLSLSNSCPHTLDLVSSGLYIWHCSSEQPLPLIHCLFTSWQWKGKQYWVLLTGGDGESDRIQNAACSVTTSRGKVTVTNKWAPGKKRNVI